MLCVALAMAVRNTRCLPHYDYEHPVFCIGLERRLRVFVQRARSAR